MKTILIIELDATTPERLFGDEQLTNLRSLMNAGCFGSVQGDGLVDDASKAIADQVAHHGVVQHRTIGPDRLDEEIGTILETLADDTIVLVVTGSADASNQGAFILISANNPINGRIEGVRRQDLAPTLLDLAGTEVPDDGQGRSLVAGRTSDPEVSPEDAEELVRERLRGLGYIA